MPFTGPEFTETTETFFPFLFKRIPNEAKLVQPKPTFVWHGVAALASVVDPVSKVKTSCSLEVCGHTAVALRIPERLKKIEAFFPLLCQRIPNKSKLIQPSPMVL